MVGSSNNGENSVVGSHAPCSQYVQTHKDTLEDCPVEAPFPNLPKSDISVVTEVPVGLPATHHHDPTISWLTESWLSKLVRYERIATAGPRIGMGVIETGLIEHHVNLIPTLHNAADFAFLRDGCGLPAGVRPKMATWPLAKKEVLAHKEWAA